MRRLSVVLVASLMLGCLAMDSRGEDISAAAVREAIDGAVTALERMQDKRTGLWPTYGRYNGGATALCTLALLNAGVASDDPAVKNALVALEKLGPPKWVYVCSLQTMAFAAADPERYRLLIRRNANWLHEAQTETGGWGYDEVSRNPDNSNTQFAILGLHAAAEADVRVPPQVWQAADAYWRREQLANGAWGYASRLGRGSMTCAGIGSLAICRRHLTQGDALVINGNVVCCGAQTDDEAIRQGLGWLGRNFQMSHNPIDPLGPTKSASPSQRYHYYYLYGVERVGRLVGHRLIGGHDWYREGAELLVENQRVSGAWQEGAQDSAPHVTTALGLLFMAKGRRPIVVAKLTHLPEDDWNRHRQDVGNLTRYVQKRWRRDLAWQTIDHHRATAEDLLHAPVLFLSGRDGLQMTAGEKASLLEFVERGGFLFAEAACAGDGFDRDFRQLMSELFPNQPLRLLPPDHPVWYAEQPVASKYQRRLYGVDACCRTAVVYCDSNLGCYWELARSDGVSLPPQVLEEVEAVLGIGANVLAYATNRRLKERLDAPVPLPQTTEASPVRRGQLSMATLQHAGGSDDAPAALTHLLQAMSQRFPLRADAQRHIVALSDPALADYPLVFLHGRREFVWNAEERQQLRNFVEHGGFVLGNAICSQVAFADAAKREISAAMPEGQWQQLPETHPLFQDAFGGFSLNQMEVRRPRPGKGVAEIETVTPKLEGFFWDGRLVVVFSRLDLSCAWESPSSSDCEGYVSTDAMKLGVNIVLYAMQN